MRRPRTPIPVLGFLLLLVFLLPGPRASGLTCAVCGGTITGRYVEEDGKNYHPECFERYRAPRCGVCGKPILGPRIQSEGINYHPDCYREAKQPRCAACGKPIEGRYLVEDGKNYHPKCHRSRSPRCAVCGEALEGSYLEDGWGNPFHARHGKDLLCPFCNRVMAISTTRGSFISSANGMRICALCAGRAVSRREQAAEILERVRQRLSLLFPVPKESFTWDLVDKARLGRLLPAGQTVSDELGITRGERIREGAEVVKRVRVSFLSGIPDWLLEGVAAHELVHVWQQLHGLEDLPLDQAEGSAEYACYLILKETGTEEGRVKIEAMEESLDPVYGIGFRKALRLAEGGEAAARLPRVLKERRGWPKTP